MLATQESDSEVSLLTLRGISEKILLRYKTEPSYVLGRAYKIMLYKVQLHYKVYNH